MSDKANMSPQDVEIANLWEDIEGDKATIISLRARVGRAEAERDQLRAKVAELEAWEDRAKKAERKLGDCETRLSYALAKLKELGFEPKAEPLWGESNDRQERIEEARRALQQKRTDE